VFEVELVGFHSCQTCGCLCMVAATFSTSLLPRRCSWSKTSNKSTGRHQLPGNNLNDMSILLQKYSLLTLLLFSELLNAWKKWEICSNVNSIVSRLLGTHLVNLSICSNCFVNKSSMNIVWRAWLMFWLVHT